MSSEAALAVSQLSKCYQIYARPQDRLLQSLWRGRKRYYREFWALRDVSFEVGRGEAVGVIGRNGSGKSTLLQLVVGILTPTSGEVVTRGRIAALLELGSGFNPEFTGRENVYLNGAILGLDRGDVARRFAAIEAFAEIGEFIDQPTKTYSSGMLMRLAFAVSVNVEPEILVVDEALAVGDFAFQFRCMERLHRLVRSGTTILFVSHDVGLVKAFCSRAVYLAGGMLRAVGAAEDVAEQYLADTRDAQRAEVAAAAPRAAGAGRIRARFADTGAARSAYGYGEEIRIEAEVELDDSIAHPALSALVQDRRMISIAGKILRLEPCASGARRRARAQFVLRAVFDTGAYHVTLRLEDRISLTTFRPVAKEVGALSFEVLREAGQDVLGMVDVGMGARELPEA